jgi:SWIM zinc finger
MSFFTAASNASLWRGYVYYESKKVLSWIKINDHEFEGDVNGSAQLPYHVVIDDEHPKRSVCNCPHAEGKRIVCKHKVALFFTVFPEEAAHYIAEVEACEKEEQEREQKRYDRIVKYVESLSVDELRNAVINTLLDEEDDDMYLYCEEEEEDDADVHL